MGDMIMVECNLCRKEKKCPSQSYGSLGIHSWQWRKVCPDCYVLWEIGKKRAKVDKAEAADGHAKIVLEVKVDGKDGDPLGDTTIRSKDIIAAMGATGLRGTSLGGRFNTPKGTVFVGQSNTASWMSGGSELVKVPESRAKAMSKIVSAIFNAIAKARIDGFNEGRNLLKSLAEGRTTVDDFSDQCDEAEKGKRPRWRF